MSFLKSVGAGIGIGVVGGISFVGTVGGLNYIKGKRAAIPPSKSSIKNEVEKIELEKSPKKDTLSRLQSIKDAVI